MGRARVLVAAIMGVALAASPATAAPKEPGGWLKPGVPLAGQQHPDPTAVTVGPYVLSTSTNHGGSDLPFVWSGDLRTWTARTQHPGRDGFRDGDKNGFFNDGIDDPRWGSFNTCRETAKTEGSCDPKELWAPTFDLVGSRWVLFSAVKISASYSSYGRFAIYRGTSATPTGLYASASSRPIVTTDTRRDPAGAIDPDVFTDPASGRSYLLYKTEGNANGNPTTLWSRRLDSSGVSFAQGSRPVKLFSTPRGSWEGHVVENPSMVRVNGVYVLFYSGNEFSSTRYATGYVVCSRGPAGGCSRPSSNRILSSTRGSYGPGGPDALTDGRGRHLLAYHAFPSQSGGRGTQGRTLRMAEFTVDARSKRVRILQREVKQAPGSAGGTWYGGPNGFTRVTQDVSGGYQPFVADLDGDDLDDVGYYGAWKAPDAARLGRAGRRMADGSAALVGQTGTFVPVSGDFDGNGRTDVFWYQPGADPHAKILASQNMWYEPQARGDALWLSRTGGGWRKIALPQDRTAIPVVGNFDGRGGDELLWFAPGGASDERWTWDASAGTMARRGTTVAASGASSPTVGDFDADGVDDILWYVPGRSRAYVWWKGSSSGSTSFAVDSTTQRAGRIPVAGDFDPRTPGAEVYWYGPRGVSEQMWSGLSRSARPKVSSARAFDGGAVYQPVVGDFDGDGVDDITWYG